MRFIIIGLEFTPKIEQITMGMLQTQQDIMRKHTEILNENQRNIAHMVKEGMHSSKKKYELCG